MKPIDVDVVIVGLGPTGLVLAHTLGQRGLGVLVLEREPAFYGNARAVYTDGECMRIFQSIGMADRLLQDMIEDVPVQLMLSDGRCLGTMLNRERPWGWALSNFFYQPALETALADALARRLSVKVLRGRECIRFEQDDDGVDVYHRPSEGSRHDWPAGGAADGAEVRVRCRYLVGADGGRSSVRAQLGIAMNGRSFPNPWLVVDIKAKDGLQGLRHLPYFAFVCDPVQPTVNCVQPDGHHRFEFMLAPGQTKEQMEDPATVRQLLSKHVDPERFEVLRQLVYTFNALVAERWRDRRVLLAGDAAHMTPQFVGQGMNAGVRDAHNLGWKLHAVIAGLASDRLLDSYQSERQPHVTAMIREAVRLKDLVSVPHRGLAALRNALMRLALRTPGVGPFLKQGRQIPGPVFARGAYFGLARQRRRSPEGTLMPQPAVRGADGRRHRLDDCLPQGFVLIGDGVDPRAALSAEERAWCARLGAGFAVLYRWGGRPFGNVEPLWPADLVELEDLSGDWAAWLRRSKVPAGCVVIVRPDRFVFAAVPARQLPQAVAQLRRRLDAPAMSAAGAVRDSQGRDLEAA